MALLEVRADAIHINRHANIDLDLKVGACFKLAGNDINKVTAFNKDSISYVKWIKGAWGKGASKLTAERDREAILNLTVEDCPSAGGRRKSRKARKSRRRITKQR